MSAVTNFGNTGSRFACVGRANGKYVAAAPDEARISNLFCLAGRLCVWAPFGDRGLPGSNCCWRMAGLRVEWSDRSHLVTESKMLKLK